MQALNAEERAVWEALEYHVGPGKPITAAVIAEKTGIRERAVREIISAMVNEGRCPLPVIGAAGAGYYISRDPAEVNEYADNLYHLGGEVFRRRDGILATARRCGVLPPEEDKQMEMAL